MLKNNLQERSICCQQQQSTGCGDTESAPLPLGVVGGRQPSWHHHTQCRFLLPNTSKTTNFKRNIEIDLTKHV